MGERADLRPADLARAAGISTQQVRNLVGAGVLPPAPRTATGYRRFDARHRRALLTYHALAAGYGQRTARAIMRSVHAEDLALALSLVDAAHAGLHEERLALRATGEALEAVAKEDPAPSPPRSGLLVGEAAAVLGVRPSALRVWEAAGLLSPRRERSTGYRRYGPADVRDGRMIAVLRRAGYPLAQIWPVLDGLRRTGSADALRAAITRRQAEMTRQAFSMLEGSGLLHHYVTGDEPAFGNDDGPARSGHAGPARGRSPV
jgi:DNA-binding transcriptional MerR regulator